MDNQIPSLGGGDFWNHLGTRNPLSFPRIPRAEAQLGHRVKSWARVWDPSPAPGAREVPNIPWPRPPQAKLIQVSPVPPGTALPSPAPAASAPPPLPHPRAAPRPGKALQNQQGTNPLLPLPGHPKSPLFHLELVVPPQPQWDPLPDQNSLQKRPARPKEFLLGQEAWWIGEFKCGAVVIQGYLRILWEALAGLVSCLCPLPLRGPLRSQQLGTCRPVPQHPS